MTKLMCGSLWWDQPSGSEGSKHRGKMCPIVVSEGHDRPVPSPLQAAQASMPCTATHTALATCHHPELTCDLECAVQILDL